MARKRFAGADGTAERACYFVPFALIDVDGVLKFALCAASGGFGWRGVLARKRFAGADGTAERACYFYFAAAYRLATSSQLMMLKKAAT